MVVWTIDLLSFQPWLTVVLMLIIFESMIVWVAICSALPSGVECESYFLISVWKGCVYYNYGQQKYSEVFPPTHFGNKNVQNNSDFQPQNGCVQVAEVTDICQSMLTLKGKTHSSLSHVSAKASVAIVQHRSYHSDSLTCPCRCCRFK